jgi:hypothetical protein
MTYTDSDAYSYLADRARANAFGFSAEGDLTAPDGTPYRYSGLLRIKWQPNSDDPLQRFNETLHVNLTPAGH